MPPSLTANGALGERSAARSWSVIDWARTSLGLASSEGSCSRQAASTRPAAASTSQRIAPGHTLRSTPPTLTHPPLHTHRFHADPSEPHGYSGTFFILAQRF